MNTYSPFTYFIMWKTTGMKYYGVRFAKKKGGAANPSQLWKTYFTSSKQVSAYRKEHGEPDVIVVHKIFENAETAREFEEYYLKRVKAKQKVDWLNKNDRRGQPILVGKENPMFGKKAPPKSRDAKLKIKKLQLSLSSKGMHPFQTDQSRKKAKERQLALYEKGEHVSQKDEFRLRKKSEAIERNKTEKMKMATKKRNAVMNSKVHVCPHCLKIGKGPNMKRYHFDNCAIIRSYTETLPWEDLCFRPDTCAADRPEAVPIETKSYRCENGCPRSSSRTEDSSVCHHC